MFLAHDVEQNKVTVRKMLDELWNQGDSDAVARYFTGRARGQTENLVRTLRTAFPDLRVQVDDLVAEDDRVVARLTFRGTHRGPFRDVPATSRPVEFTAIRVYRVGGGTIGRTWAAHDAGGILDQLSS